VANVLAEIVAGVQQDVAQRRAELLPGQTGATRWIFSWKVTSPTADAAT